MSNADRSDNSNELESLSALMDGESSEFEARRILKATTQNSDLADTWRRYHLMQSVLKGQQVTNLVDISAGVMAAIDAQEQTSSEKNEIEAKPKWHWWQGASSMAAAASVTLAVLIGVQQFSTQTSDLVSPQTGVIERSGVSSSILPTSLAAEPRAITSAPAIEVIRLSEDMRRSIDEYRTTVKSLNASWEPAWLPEGYVATGVQLEGEATTRLYTKSGELLTLAVEPLTDQSPAPGSYSQDGLTALGRVVDQRFVSLVGQLSLDEADRVISSLQWDTAVNR